MCLQQNSPPGTPLFIFHVVGRSWTAGIYMWGHFVKNSRATVRALYFCFCCVGPIDISWSALAAGCFVFWESWGVSGGNWNGAPMALGGSSTAAAAAGGMFRIASPSTLPCVAQCAWGACAVFACACVFVCNFIGGVCAYLIVPALGDGAGRHNNKCCNLRCHCSVFLSCWSGNRGLGA